VLKLQRIVSASRSERGATAVEYGFVISLIAAVVAVAVSPFGTAVANLLTDGLAAFP
jgi:Flp pilus assembly pilin Flp